MKMEEDMDADPEGAKERNLDMFKVEGQALIYTSSFVMYNRDPRCKDLFYPSVLKRAIHL